jgi:hydroxyacylglutathione hydrolase
MLFKRFYDERLAQASYMIGCQATGEALIVDPLRDFECYITAAAAERLTIRHVTETHIHADFASGSLELAHRTGAQLYLSDEGGPDWKYGFATEHDAQLLKEGSTINVGKVQIDVLHTPGHTPEHICFMITDTAGANAPMGLLTGDFIFVGDVGRPDLLERAAGQANTMRDGARLLFRSLQRTASLPDYLQIWPGHGAGSACGKSLGAVPQSTLGYERLFNWAFQIKEEEAFIDAVLSGQPTPPRYFAEMKKLNKVGPALDGGRPAAPELDLPALRRLRASGAIIIDARDAKSFGAGHIPGTICLPKNRSFLTYAGSILPYDRDLFIITESARPTAAAELTKDLSLIGLDRVAGYFLPTIVQEWGEAGETIGTTMQLDPKSASVLTDRGAVVVDVRTHDEWDSGHINGAMHIPLSYLEERAGEIPVDRPIVVQCQTGSRSAIAASILERAGRKDVAHMVGGIVAWERAGCPVTRSDGVLEPGTLSAAAH